MVDFADSPEQAVFRKEVREFIEERLPEELKARDDDEGGRGGFLGGNLSPEREAALKKWRGALIENG